MYITQGVAVKMEKLTEDGITQIMKKLRGTKKEEHLVSIYFASLSDIYDGLTATKLCNMDVLPTSINGTKEFEKRLENWIDEVDVLEKKYENYDCTFHKFTTYQRRKVDKESEEYKTRKNRKEVRIQLNKLKRKRPHAASQPYYSILLSDFSKNHFLKKN